MAVGIFLDVDLDASEGVSLCSDAEGDGIGE